MRDIETYTLKVPGQIEMTFMNYGGIIQKLLVPDKNGIMEDIVLGFDHPEDYRKQTHPYFGAIIGRYANRIAKGEFTLHGERYRLAVNNGPNALHGGINGFDKAYWKVRKSLDGMSYTLSHESPDGDQGYPGKLSVDVTYTVTKGRELVIDYRATTDRETIINLTNHSYFNLSGRPSSILDHELWINADYYTVVDSDLTPTGDLMHVQGAKSFLEHKRIGKEIEHVTGGYDHNYVLNEAPIFDPKARLVHPASGRMMEILTTEPGIQFYSGNFLDGRIKGKNGVHYKKHQGLCLETQHFPDSPNHPKFPTTTLKPEEVFVSKTIYKFSS